MSTVATAALKSFANEWAKLFKSAVMSGIVGDKAHRSGYHLSREDCVSGDYSVARPDDQYGQKSAAAAVDMTMDAADMKVCTLLLISAYANANDPRRKYLNAFNGTTDGKAARRWDVYARTIKASNSSHVWHVHLEIRRKYVNSRLALAAVLSIIKGETVAQYLRTIGVSPGASSPAAKSLVPTFGGELRRNDSAAKANPNVRIFQAQLIKRGWTSIGPADGYFGVKLESVVKRWQAMCGLKADGIVGPRTWPTIWTRPIGK